VETKKKIKHIFLLLAFYNNFLLLCPQKLYYCFYSIFYCYFYNIFYYYFLQPHFYY
jgi:hypothetical protein